VLVPRFVGLRSLLLCGRRHRSIVVPAGNLRFTPIDRVDYDCPIELMSDRCQPLPGQLSGLSSSGRGSCPRDSRDRP
jgi:hypothetical protein